MRKTQLKRLVRAASGDVAARLVPPSKESNYRWGAQAEGRLAHGDTPEEACDNLRDMLSGIRTPVNPQLPERGLRLRISRA